MGTKTRGGGRPASIALETRQGAAATEEEARHALEQVLRSEAFQRSERLHRFLSFVCEQTLKGEGSSLHEYLIGAEVFDRGPGYSPQEDGIVRRQAHALRRKLQEYYAHEGRNDPVRIDLPIGRYVPVFQQTEDTVEPGQEKAPTGHAVSRLRFWSVAAVAAVAILMVGWLAGSRARTLVPAQRQASPEVREIWGSWLDDPAGATICFSNPLTTVIKHLKVPQPPEARPLRLQLTSEQDKFFRSVVDVPPGGYLYFAPAISQAKMGEAIAAVHLSALFAEAGRPIRATQSRFMTWEDLTRENIILLGHNEANPWIDRLLEPYPLRMIATHGAQQRAIINTQPAPSESKEHHILYADGAVTGEEEYALVSMIPGVDGRHRLLLISGLNTQATQIAAEYFTTPARLKEFTSELRKRSARQEGPRFFQAVLRTKVHDKVPTEVSLVALKVLQRGEPARR